MAANQNSGDHKIALPFTMLVDQLFPESSVVATWVDEPVERSKQQSAEIDRAWSEAINTAQSQRRELFAGPMARLIAWTVEGDSLSLRLGPTDYREFVGTNLNPAYLNEYGDTGILANPIGISVSVATSDDRIIVQHPSEHVFESPGMFHVCGGNLEPREMIQGSF